MADIVINPETGERRFWNGSTWAPLPSTKAAGYQYLTEHFTPGDKSEAAGFRAFKDKDNMAQSSAATGIRSARRLEGLLARQEAQGQKTGGIYGVPVIGAVAGFMDPEIREMDAIQSEMARGKRQPGEGAISDFDAQQFLNMSPGRDKPLATNKAMIRAQRLADDAVQQKRQFLEWYQGTYGNTNGSTELWERYAQDNPIFAPESETAGSPVLNEGRQNWRSWLGMERGAGDARESQAVTDTKRAEQAAGYKTRWDNPKTRAIAAKAPDNNEPTPAVIRMIDRMQQAGEWDTRAPRGSSEKNPFVAVNPSVAKRLKSGVFYMDGQGNIWQK